MNKLTITILMASAVTACGLTETPASTFRIEMLASGQAPQTATGNEEPRWEKFTLTGVSMTSADGAESYTLYDGTDPKETKVVTRPQLIYQKSVGDFAGKALSAVTLTFDPAVTAGSADRDDLAVTLGTNTFALTEDFTVEEGKTRTLMVRVNWGNTVADATLEAPDLVLDFP